MKIEKTGKPFKFNESYRKENKLDYGYKLIVPNDERGYGFAGSNFDTLADIRVYFAGSTFYAAAWFSENGSYIRGTGKAGGGGYFRKGKAIQEAVNNAGIDTDCEFEGDGLILDFLAEYGNKFTDKAFYIVEFHG